LRRAAAISAKPADSKASIFLRSFGVLAHLASRKNWTNGIISSITASYKRKMNLEQILTELNRWGLNEAADAALTRVPRLNGSSALNEAIPLDRT
jgi:hypothetical protein